MYSSICSGLITPQFLRANRPHIDHFRIQQRLAAQQPPEITGMAVGNIEQGRSGQAWAQRHGCVSGIQQRQNGFIAVTRAWRVTVFLACVAHCVRNTGTQLLRPTGLTGMPQACFAPSMRHRPVRLLIPADTAADRQTRHRSPRWEIPASAWRPAPSTPAQSGQPDDPKQTLAQ